MRPPSSMHRAAIALFLVTLLGSCAIVRETENKPLFPQLVAELVPGQSTSAQVVELLGAPADVIQLGRRSAYYYEFRSTKRAGLLLILLILFNTDTREDRVWVFFDENDVLTHVGSTFEGSAAEYAMPWEDIHDS